MPNYPNFTEEWRGKWLTQWWEILCLHINLPDFKSRALSRAQFSQCNVHGYVFFLPVNILHSFCVHCLVVTSPDAQLPYLEISMTFQSPSTLHIHLISGSYSSYLCIFPLFILSPPDLCCSAIQTLIISCTLHEQLCPSNPSSQTTARISFIKYRSVHIILPLSV